MKGKIQNESFHKTGPGLFQFLLMQQLQQPLLLTANCDPPMRLLFS